ncbi:MAG: DinB family protein [Fimbriimonas sp.]|nr:DinB family protein [Fimbriimonas sp.]
MVDLIASSQKLAVDGMEEFLRIFSFVPDDKLTWAPTPTAKSAIRIAAHTALYAERFAHMIETRKLPAFDSLVEWLAQMNAEEVAITTRAEIEAIFRQGTDRVLAALDSITPDDIAAPLDFGVEWTPPMTFLMNLPGMHAISHAAQIDYLQTCWDDQEVHF